jgi:superfamily II DNA or RNA helicase
MTGRGCLANLVPRPPFRVVKTMVDSMVGVKFAGEQEAATFAQSLLVRPRASPFDREPPLPIATASVDGAWVRMPRALGQALFSCPPPDRVPGDPAELGDLVAAPLPHQRDPIAQLVSMFTTGGQLQAVLRAGCGDGKTYSALAVAHALGGRLLVLVHTDLLVKQWVGAATKFLTGARVGIVKGAKSAGADCNVVVASIQTLVSRDVPAEFFTPFLLTVIDEGHHVPAETFSRVVNRIGGRRLALSATPDGRSDGLAKILYWVCGEQVEMDGPRVMAGVEIHMFTPRTRQAGSPIATRTRRRLSREVGRNLFLTQVIQKKVAEGHTVLVFSEFIEHVEALAATVPDSGVYTGKSKRNVEDARVLFATYSSFKEGVDFGHISCIVMAMPAPGNVEQILGRIRRSDTRTVQACVVDIRDIPLWNMFKYSKLNAFYSARNWEVK